MPSEMTRDEILLQKLAVLREEHRDLDIAITSIEATTRPDRLTIQRLKKKKLALKDQIAQIEDEITPDIIA